MNYGRDNAIRPGVDIIEEARRASSTKEAVFLVRDGFGFAHVTFHMNVSGIAPVDYPFVRTTYSPHWISRYILRDYLGIDPIVRAGFASTRPFAWHELSMNEREQALMADARDHGIGRNGYCVPTVDRLSRRSLLSVSTDMELSSWADFIRQEAHTVTEISQILHRKALEEVPLSFPTPIQLAPREVECLLWTARGKDSKAIAAILELSEYTVRGYLRSARQKLECRTLSQAVAKAMRQRIIDP